MENDNKKTLKMLKESFLMYEKTKKECFNRMNEDMNPDGSKKWDQKDIDERISLIQQMQDDVKKKYILCGGDENDLQTINIDNTKHKKNIVKKTNSLNTQETKTKKNISLNNKTVENSKNINLNETKVLKPNFTEYTNDISVVHKNWDDQPYNESFDVIPLPSKGECYDNNMSTIAVSYLTANDENMIISPNLYRDGLILDYLLKAKIKNKNINPDDLLEGDREAIILWLRATSYGTKYPITVTDNKTGIDFDTVVDLTQIKHKPFVLKGDSDGYFDFQLPVSKDNVKFRFLTHGDIKQLEKIDIEEQNNVKKDRLKRIAEELSEFIESDNELTKETKMRLYEAKRNITKWYEDIEVDNEFGYTHTLTNRLELSIVSINEEYDRVYISNYVQNMNVRDALSLRKYITENEPGLDYSVMVERPESLGGGSMPVFLSLDEYIFLNIA